MTEIKTGNWEEKEGGSKYANFLSNDTSNFIFNIDNWENKLHFFKI